MSQITAITVPRLEEPADSKANSHTTASLRTASQVTDKGEMNNNGSKGREAWKKIGISHTEAHSDTQVHKHKCREANPDLIHC